VGARLIRELNGIPSIDLEEELVTKKMIATTRMFGHPVSSLEDIREAVASYTSRAAEKLRRQYSAAKVVSVFVVPREDRMDDHFRHGPTLSRYAVLSRATSLTQELIKPAMGLVEQLYEKGRVYKKAGVTLSELVPDSSIQGNLFAENENQNDRYLMDMIDNINFSQRDDILKFACTGLQRNWKMRQELRSPRYTTRWGELPEVR